MSKSRTELPSVVLDYETFQAVLSGASPALVWRLRTARDEFRPVTVSSVLWFAAGRAWGKLGRARVLQAFLQPTSGIQVVEFDLGMAQLAVRLLRDHDQLKDLDAISLATAKVIRRPLAVLRRDLHPPLAGVATVDWSRPPR